MGKNWGLPTFLGNLKMVVTKKRLGTTDLGQKLWEKIDFLQKNCNFLGEGEKHIKT